MSGLFTFQYVSINTLDPSSTDNIQRVFTFQYVSINTRKRLGNLKNRGVDLHSNMFLLIRLPPDQSVFSSIPFTFQYVSINTET